MEELMLDSSNHSALDRITVDVRRPCVDFICSGANPPDQPNRTIAKSRGMGMMA